MLEGIERRGPYVFTRADGTGPIVNFYRIERDLDALLPGLSSWRLHDLRRTAATNWSRLRIDLETRRAMLNHVQKRLDGTYDVHDRLDEKRAGLAKWALELDEIVHGRSARNVIRIR